MRISQRHRRKPDGCLLSSSPPSDLLYYKDYAPADNPRRLQWLPKFTTVTFPQLQEETNNMVNEPGKLTGTERVRKDEPKPGQFAIQKGGEEESYEQLLDQYGGRKFAQGDVMKGTVLKITDTDVIVDIGYKSEGIIPVNQFIAPNSVPRGAIG